MTADIDAFIARRSRSGANERANFQSFIGELFPLLGVASPEPGGPYRFERRVTFPGTDERSQIRPLRPLV